MDDKRNTRAGADQANSLPDNDSETQSTGVPEWNVIDHNQQGENS
jgi:hypothetical protein